MGGDLTGPIFHLLALGHVLGVPGFALGIKERVFRYQHVAIPNAKFWHWSIDQCESPTRMALRCSGI